MPAVEAVDDDDELEVPCPWLKATSFQFELEKDEKFMKKYLKSEENVKNLI